MLGGSARSREATRYSSDCLVSFSVTPGARRRGGMEYRGPGEAVDGDSIVVVAAARGGALSVVGNKNEGAKRVSHIV
jgi:hypothetical protein